MSIVYGPNVGLMAGAADGDLYGDAMRAFQRGVDSFLMPTVDGYRINTPPASPVEGSFYIIGAAPSGDWAGHAREMARWSSHISDWDFYTPKNGWMAQSKKARETYRYTGGAWEIFYQEGTWTPTISGSITPGSNTYGYNNGVFVKNGSSVSCPFSIYMTNKDPLIAGNLSIAGLPFVPLSRLGGCAIGYMYGLALSGSQLTAWPGAATGAVAMLAKSGAPYGPLVAADLASSCELYGVLTFNI